MPRLALRCVNAGVLQLRIAGKARRISHIFRSSMLSALHRDHPGNRFRHNPPNRGIGILTNDCLGTRIGIVPVFGCRYRRGRVAGQMFLPIAVEHPSTLSDQMAAEMPAVRRPAA